jgi:hypothetical protein
MDFFTPKFLSKFTQTTQLTILTVTTLSAIFIGWIVVDYRAWLAFGTGGTPANFQGYLRITQFRIKRLLAFDDLKNASSLSSTGRSYLQGTLPKREGQPPKIISRTLPQRQFPEPLDSEISQRLHQIPHVYASKYPHLLTLDKSITEGHSTDAIYARPTLSSRVKGAHDPILGDEIAHVHPAENSLHVWLTEADCKKVVSAGWGERFPLASLKMVDVGWTFVYAPRSMQHVEVIERIVEAGIQNVTGAELSL